MALFIPFYRWIFQFTPLCERLHRFISGTVAVLISIHASLREATLADRYAKIWHNISIHASLREATIWVCQSEEGREDFNSRLSARGYKTETSQQTRLILFQFTPLCERLQQKQTIYSCISA